MRRSAERLSTFFVALFLCCFAYMYLGRISDLHSQFGSQKRQKFKKEEEEPHRHFEATSRQPCLIPSDEVLQTMSERDLMKLYWRYVNTIQILCRNQTRFGSIRSGGKEVCLDGIYKPSTPCIVYSFGSNFDFGFDLDVHNYLGCDVYTYDPTMDGKPGRIPTEINFFSVGLAGRDYVTENKWPMKTLESIFKDNNHTTKTIDILKMDIEGFEWHSIPNIMESGLYKQIRQILIEAHAGHKFGNPNGPFWGNVDVAKQLRALRLLYEYGFRLFMREHVHCSFLKISAPPQRQIAPQNEISLINVKFLQHE